MGHGNMQITVSIGVHQVCWQLLQEVLSKCFVESVQDFEAAAGVLWAILVSVPNERVYFIRQAQNAGEIIFALKSVHWIDSWD